MGSSWASRRSTMRLAHSFLDITFIVSIIVWKSFVLQKQNFSCLKGNFKMSER